VRTSGSPHTPTYLLVAGIRPLPSPPIPIQGTAKQILQMKELQFLYSTISKLLRPVTQMSINLSALPLKRNLIHIWHCLQLFISVRLPL
jgi:hypothetical protein